MASASLFRSASDFSDQSSIRLIFQVVIPVLELAIQVQEFICVCWRIDMIQLLLDISISANRGRQGLEDF